MAQRRFAVEKGLTNSGVHELLIYRRTDDPTKCFQFQHKRTTNDGPSYICMGCSFYYKSLSKEERDFSVNSISVSNNLAYFLSDPEALNHGCIRSEKYTYGYECKKVEQLRKEVVRDVKTYGTKPSVAKKQLMLKVEEAYPETSDTAMMHLPNRQALGRTFRYARSTTQNEEITPTHIPEHLCVSTVPSDGYQSNVVRYYSADEPAFVLLCDRENLKALQKATIWIMDGTYKYCPQGFKQTYTIHAVFTELPDRLSSFLAAIAFLPGKTKPIYIELFDELKYHIEAEFGDLGPEKTVIMDGEEAAHGGIKEVLPEFKSRSCFFHFMKNVRDYAKTYGFLDVFENEVSSAWINAVIGSVFLPPELITIVFDYLLDNAPSSISGQFVQYFRGYWRSRLDRLCAWNGDIPRTTNVAEGYHNGIQTMFENEKSPVFSKAFSGHVSDLAENAYQFIRFDQGKDELRLREPKYRKIDKKIADAKKLLSDYLSVNEEPHMQHLTGYCRHMRYLTNPEKKEKSHPDSILSFDPIEEEKQEAPKLLPPRVATRIKRKTETKSSADASFSNTDSSEPITKKTKHDI